jgi:stage II sporulation protein D
MMDARSRLFAAIGLAAAGLLVPLAQPVADAGAPPVAEQTFAITGAGNSHGVGLSQRGARGRALAGQSYTDILNFYFSNHPLGSVATSTIDIRVILANDTIPTLDKPARVTARLGRWTSALFPGLTFAADSYLDVVQDGVGGWQANVVDSVGAPLASAAVTTTVVMQPADSTTLFEMRYRDWIPSHRLNRGQISIRPRSTGLQTLNILNLETYLRGVIACEMPSSYPVEALRAQAIAARGEALVNINPTANFDTYPYNIDMVYGGTDCETSATNKAVNDTAGIVVLNSKGKPADTVFHDTAGGSTESNEYAWPSTTGALIDTPISYQRGRLDVDANGVPYEAGSPTLNWSAGEITLSQLSAILAADSRTNVGTLTSFEFKRGVSGRVYQAVLTGSAATKSVSGAIFKSAYNKAPVSGTLKSTAFWFEPLAPPDPVAPPTVISRAPAPGATGVNRRAVVEVGFSEAVSGVSGTTLRLVDNATGTRLSASVSYDAAAMKARLVPAALLPAGKLLRVELRTGIAAAGSGLGLEPESWTFRVVNDSVAPTVVSARTAAGSRTVYRSSAFKVVFSEPVVNVGPTTVRLRNVSSGTWVGASVSYDAKTMTATLTPTSLLRSGKTYKLVVKPGIWDLAGNSAVSYSWKFVVR